MTPWEIVYCDSLAQDCRTFWREVSQSHRARLKAAGLA